MTTHTVDLTLDLKDLIALAGEGDDVEDLLRRGVDWLARLVRYDLATVFLLEDKSRLVARVARGPLAGPAVRAHALELEQFPSIREILETRRARAMLEDDHTHGDGDAFDGVLDLPAGHSCMVVPLCAGDEQLGVLTLDRAECEPYDQATVNLVEVYGQILAIAARSARQQNVLKRLHQQDRTQRQRLEAQAAGDPFGLESSRSPLMRELVRQARQVAGTDTPVLLVGETGTGKERLARAIHLWSGRAEQPFVAINAAAIPADLLESELFGHTKGAFTGAERERAGRFQAANGGTLLLDEIGDLPLPLQAKLLRALQSGTFEPVGSDATVRVDVRVLASTNVDLERAVAEGRFRQDLFYRLNVFPLRLPPLRERLEDLPVLCAAMLTEQATRTGRPGRVLDPAALTKLARHTWPGNLRELANLLERATILSSGETLRPAAIDLPSQPELPSHSSPAAVQTLDAVQRAHIERVLRLTGGKIYGPGGAAELLGLKPSTLQSRMKKLGIERTVTAT